MKKNMKTIARSRVTNSETVRADIETRSPRGVVSKNTAVDEAADLPEHPSRVRVGGSLTKNLGDYESAKISVSIEMPCGNSPSDIRKAYKRVRALVEKCMEDEYQEVIGND